MVIPTPLDMFGVCVICLDGTRRVGLSTNGGLVATTNLTECRHHQRNINNNDDTHYY